MLSCTARVVILTVRHGRDELDGLDFRVIRILTRTLHSYLGLYRRTSHLPSIPMASAW